MRLVLFLKGHKLVHDFQLLQFLFVCAKGDIPWHSSNAACVVIRKKAHMFGGRDVNDIATDRIHTLSPWEGEFKRLSISGEKPTPRHNHQGWPFNDKAYFFAGNTKSKQDTGRILVPDQTKGDLDNLLACFDPENNKWTKPNTTGRSYSN